MKIGIGVEGPSDFHFWNKVLHKYFKGHRFDIRNLKTREKLIRETPNLMEAFRSSGCVAGFALVDLDDDPCVTSVLDLFDERVRMKLRAERYMHLCVAIKEIESWYLADAVAINSVIAGCAWQAPADTGRTSKGKIRDLVKKHRGQRASFNEIAFAQDMAPKFDPARALPHSASLRYFWGILEGAVQGQSV